MTNHEQEPTREANPGRFLRIFSEITGMESTDMRLIKLHNTGPRFLHSAREAGVIGAVVIGSSAQKDSKPKDLDVVLVVDRSQYRPFYFREYVDEIQFEFNMRLSRERAALTRSSGMVVLANHLDIFAVIDKDGKPFRSEFAQEAIRRNERFIVFAFTPEDAKAIYQAIQK